jgi:putative flavoprotein involved in K+ transport
VIVATGHCDVPLVPAWAAGVPRDVHQVDPTRYRNPARLPPGGVLVIGASASGVQIADELRRAGREVTLAVGGHTRLPRRHLGRDILWWLDTLNVLTETRAEVRDLAAARRQPSMQLIGDGSGRDLDLATLERAGVRLVGRALGASSGMIAFADDLAATTAAADARARRIVDRIDRFATTHQLAACGPRAAIAPILAAAAPRHLALAAERITTIVWATGFARSYPWLAVPGVVEHGELVHDGGVTPSPGMYALGLRFQRRRNSSFLDGVGADAHVIVNHIARRLGHRAAAA